MSATMTAPTAPRRAAPRVHAAAPSGRREVWRSGRREVPRYRRRRIGVAAVAVGLVVLGGAAGDGLADRGGGEASSAQLPATYTVQHGDTMWEIAARLRPHAGVSAYVDALVSLNGGTALVPGQVLRLP